MGYLSSLKTFCLAISIAFAMVLFLNGCKQTPERDYTEEWVSLFDGSNYQDWTPKFAGYELGVNHKNRFVYKDSLMSVRYAETDTFNGNFGHLYYKQKFSYYKLRANYRFVGNQMEGGPAWAFRNNGLMLHCQEPASIGLDQDFPISLELQLLGGNGTDERTTANLCTPGTNVVLGDTLFRPHCIGSISKTYHGDQWVEVEAIVLGDSIVQHIMDGQVVFEFSKPTIGGGNISNYKENAYQEGKALKEGFISIQAETHPIDFKSIELLNLCGCMDEKAINYKPYYIKADNSTCIYE